MKNTVQSIIDDLESGLAELRMHFESLGSIFGESEKAAPRGRRSKKIRFTTNTSRYDPYKSFKFRARRHPGRAAVKTTGVAIAEKVTAPKKRKKMKMSAALRAQRKLQGRYMGMIRRLPKAKQAQVKKVRKEKGYESALKMIR